MTPEPERVHVYVRSTVPCPACKGDLELTLEVGAIERFEALGVSEEEQFEAIANGLLSRRIVCRHCQEARQN